MSWRYTIAKHEAALREYYATFPWRTLAVKQFVEQLLEKWRANPPGPPKPAPRVNDGESCVRWRGYLEIGALRDGMDDPGE
jgi:hypothetical protein